MPKEIDKQDKTDTNINNVNTSETNQDHLSNHPEKQIPLNNSPITPTSQKFRMGLLMVLVSGSLLVFGRSVIDSTIGKPTPFTFPEQIALEPTQTQTKLEAQGDIVDPKEFFGQPKYLFGKKYKYSLDGIPIDIDLRYAVGSEGDLYYYIKGVTNIEISEEDLRKQSIRKDPIGFYATFTKQDRVYLTACINPRGISTVTSEQFNDNASSRVMDRDILIGWLLGQKDLRDRRCLWTLMSAPITSESDLHATSQKLEKVWISWYEWWKPRFPQP
ncbi:cyanoexosortase A system-associated protein [Pseudanabaena sp. UWO310]|uniref:cyanoexosortase A system-associated protein n=1 Tax=Pseudanabaena sp. UWO310 TaxID=2480795 RepID=UPI00115A79C9|nr:cyanoexosortase A system-associated protein [Pseudanabaena sp. UWO310]TYQ30342.1 cyanoexosortase A system-associated protein [Pseudanabaena sp. UWO310]